MYDEGDALPMSSSQTKNHHLFLHKLLILSWHITNTNKTILYEEYGVYNKAATPTTKRLIIITTTTAAHNSGTKNECENGKHTKKQNNNNWNRILR